jgi:hypothetical protein
MATTKSKSRPRTHKPKKKGYKQQARWIKQTMREAAIELEKAEKEYRDEMAAVGDMLMDVKEALPHGEFLPWLEENFDFNERTARQYMRFARGETDTLMTGQQRS